jgi:hypothetical protein
MIAGSLHPERTLLTFIAASLAVAGYAERPSSGLAANAKRSCSVTQPNGNSPKVGKPAKKLTSFNYGNGSLWIALWWPRRGILAGVAPDGGVEATIGPDGSIRAKVGWYRGVNGKLTIAGRRLDATARRLRADVPHGYGLRGFQSTAIIFPTEGCWKVTGRIGRASLTFVVKVTKRSVRPQPRAHSRLRHLRFVSLLALEADPVALVSDTRAQLRRDHRYPAHGADRWAILARSGGHSL